MTDSDGAGPGPVPDHCPSIKPGGRERLWPATGVVQAEDHRTVTLQVTQAARVEAAGGDGYADLLLRR